MRERKGTPVRRTERDVLRENAPWKPPKWELADAAALQALLRGDADAEQQKRALRFIVEHLCGTYDMAYRPGEDGRRDTDFALGRAFVGQQIVKLTKLNLSVLRRNT